MDKEYFRTLIKSNCRIELLLRAILQGKYGEIEANRVYTEIINVVEKNIKID